MLRRGQSSIVGGTFLVLIILTSYGLYTTYSRNMTLMASNVREMEQEDLDRGIEDLDFYYKKRGTKFMDLHLRNTGSVTINVIYIADLTNFTFKDVKNHSIYINPTVEYNVSTFLGLYYPGFPENHTLQLVSARGNTYETDYIPIVTSYITWKELSDELAALIRVFGDFIFDYRSFGWTYVNKTNDWAEQPWWESWSIKAKNQDMVFRINVTYYGETPSVQLGEDCVLLFRELSQAQTVKIAEIETALGGYNNERFRPYEVQTFTFNQTKTLYFRLDSTNSLKKDENYESVIGLYAQSYAQSFPLIIVEVT